MSLNQPGLFPVSTAHMRGGRETLPLRDGPDTTPRPSVGGHPVAAQIPGQLPAFLSAHEIKRDYRPLPADYSEGSEEYSQDSRGTATRVFDPFHRYHAGTFSTGGIQQYGPRTTPKTNEGTSTYPWRDQVETADELWERKAEEADEAGLTGRLSSQGVLNPVQLSLNKVPEHAKTDSAGYRPVLGGHHRIAAMSEIDPHQLMPVLHYERQHPPRMGPDAEAYPYEGRSHHLHSALSLSQGLAAEREANRQRSGMGRLLDALNAMAV